MIPRNFVRLALAAACSIGLWAGTALGATVVSVKLWDKGAAPMAMDLAYPATGADMSKATMGMTLSTPTAKAGVVTFQVTNISADTIHEMIVMYMADPTQPLPYIAADARVDEDKAGDKGEVSELDPGASGTLTVVLKPGKYLLICNIAGHFAAGMWAPLEVTK
ncbi:MAG: sulfocyanin-like copper-binding protein [Devosia sp.]